MFLNFQGEKAQCKYLVQVTAWKAEQTSLAAGCIVLLGNCRFLPKLRPLVVPISCNELFGPEVSEWCVHMCVLVWHMTNTVYFCIAELSLEDRE